MTYYGDGIKIRLYSLYRSLFRVLSYLKR